MDNTQKTLRYKLAQLEADPEYAALSFEQQTLAKKEIIDFVLQADPEYMQLPGNVKQNVTSDIALDRRPVFKNPNVARGLDEIFTASEQGQLDKGTMNRVAFAKGFMDQSLLGAGARLLSGIDKTVTTESYTPSITAFTGSEGDKAMAYLRSRSAEQDVPTSTGRAAQTVGSVVGFAGDFLVFHGAWAKLTGKAVSAISMGLAARNTGIKAWAARVAIPAFVSGTSSGMFGVVKEEAIAQVNDDDARKQDTFKKVLKTYGEYALLDYALNLAIGTVAPYFMAFKHLKHGAKDWALADLPSDQVELLVKQAVNGTIDPALFGQLDDISRTYILGQRDLRLAAAKVGSDIRLSPYNDMLFKAQAAHMNVHYNEADGVYEMFKIGKKGKIEYMTTPDIVKAKREISEELVAKFDTLKTDEARQSFLEMNGNMMEYSKVSKSIDGTFDPTKAAAGLDKKTEYLLKPKNVDRKFVSPVDRPYIGGNEADMYENALAKGLAERGGFVKRFKVKAPEEMLDAVSKGNKPFTGGKAINIINQTGTDDVLVMIRKAATPEAIAEAEALAVKALNAGSNFDAVALRNMYLMEAGYDGIIKSATEVEMFYPDKLKFIAKEFNPAKGTIGKLDVTKVDANPITTRATMYNTFEGKLSSKTFVANRNILADTAVNKFIGNVDEKSAQDFAKVYLGGLGIKGKNVVLTTSTQLTDSVESMIKGDVVRILVPETITDPKIQRKVVASLLDNLNDAAKKLGSEVKAPTGDAINRLIVKNRIQYKVPFDNYDAQKKWIQNIIEGQNGSFAARSTGFEVKLPKQAPITATTLEELTDKLLVKTLDMDYLKLDLSRQGYTLSKVTDQFVVRGSKLDKPITGKTIPELLEKMNYRPAKISNKLAPKVTQIDPDAVTVKFDAGVAIGNKGSLKRMLSNFEDTNYMASLRKISGGKEGDIFIRPTGDFEVHIPEMGYIERFAPGKLGDAREFVLKKWKTFSNLQDISKRRGLEMWYDSGKMKISDGKEVFTAANADEAAKILRKFPDSTGAQEVLQELDPEALTAIDKVLRNFDLSKIPPVDDSMIKVYGDFAPADAKPWSFRDEARSLMENTDYWFEKTMQRLNAPEVLRKYRNLETTSRITQIDVNTTRRAVNHIFSPEGKLIPLERRKAIFYHMGAQDEKEIMNAYEIFGELTDSEQAIAKQLRTLLGENINGTLTGLAGKFGVDPNLFVNNYMPRIMDWVTKNKKQLEACVTAEELVDAVYGNKAPKHLKAFFQNMRASDILTFKALDDPIVVLDHYNKIGHRKLYMAAAWEELYEAGQKADLPASAWHKINRYREQLMGVHNTSGEQTLKQMGKVLGDSLGIENGENLFEAYFTVNYLTNMGWRPWLALRNTTQIFTTLAPRIGNEWVNKGLKKTIADGEEGYKYLKAIGAIPETPPFVHELLEADRGLGKLAHKGLRMFKASDEITRAVAYNSATARFDDALGKMKKGVFSDMDTFIKESGVSKMDDDIIREVRRLVSKGTEESIGAARAKYGTQLIEDTMFGYRSSQSPMLFSGSLWGKMFGQYGTYSAGYRANIYRGLAHGSVGDKAAFVARFLGNQTALWAAAGAVGVKANNFIPGMPALFGGGPNFEVGVAMAQAISSDYRGEQSRAKLRRFFSPVDYTQKDGLRLQYPQMFPGNIQYRYAQKFLEYLDRGDRWKAFLALTTTPTTDDDSIFQL